MLPRRRAAQLDEDRRWRADCIDWQGQNNCKMYHTGEDDDDAAARATITAVLFPLLRAATAPV